VSDVKKIGVIGLGLIGGSILKGLRQSDFELIGVSRSETTVNQALQENLISQGSTSLEIMRDADLIFVCTPINKTIETLENLYKTAKKGAIITDVASIKSEITAYANENLAEMHFIGGHPMAGTEEKGLNASIDGLFAGNKWVLTPSEKATSEDISELSRVISTLGAEVVSAEAETHDEAAALISHLALLVSQTMFSTLENYPDENISTLAKKLASSGFRDTTRLSGGNVELSKDMLIQNKKNVLKTLENFKKSLAIIENNLENDEENFLKIIEEISHNRQKMYSSEGKNLTK